jgi:HPt (histidine-containing phosphotransfer) domain-containing protein
MKTPLFPQSEVERIKALQDLLILDTPPEDKFDVITAYCQARFQVEIAVVSLVDSDRQWFKSICGLDAKETPRNVSFCGHAILNDTVMIVENALDDDRFFDNPLVVGPPNIRFYAGAPLKLSGGSNVGTLCLIDSTPKCLLKEELEHLVVLAHMVSMLLENVGRIEDCRGNCLYGKLDAECPYKSTKQPLPGICRGYGSDVVPAFDHEGALKRFGMDDLILREVVTASLEDLKCSFDNLKHCISAGDANESRRLAHSIKGAAGSIGAVALSAVAAEIEVYAKSESLSMAAAMFPDMGLEFHRLQSALIDIGWIS